MVASTTSFGEAPKASLTRLVPARSTDTEANRLAGPTVRFSGLGGAAPARASVHSPATISPARRKLGPGASTAARTALHTRRTGANSCSLSVHPNSLRALGGGAGRHALSG